MYEKAHDTLWEMKKQESLSKMRHPVLCYELTMDGRTQRGLVACASIDDYQSIPIRRA
ncbi:MAG: DUF1015 family protein, partial [Lachnospiraceae bacterium]